MDHAIRGIEHQHSTHTPGFPAGASGAAAAALAAASACSAVSTALHRPLMWSTCSTSSCTDERWGQARFGTWGRWIHAQEGERGEVERGCGSLACANWPPVLKPRLHAGAPSAQQPALPHLDQVCGGKVGVGRKLVPSRHIWPVCARCCACKHSHSMCNQITLGSNFDTTFII